MLKEALRYSSSRDSRFVDELRRLVKIPSCGFPGHPPEQLVRSAKAVAQALKKAGLEHVRLLRLPGVHPYVYGDWLRAPGAPTVLLYAHHDVQPPGRRKLWKSPPYAPTVRRGRLYGRGAADDKAGIVIHTAAIESYLKTSGKLPLNVRVIIEGEEETGSVHLEKFLKKYSRLMSADTILLSDTGNFDTGIPSVTTSLRGLAATSLTVRTADHPLHSGMWGGPLPDPAIALAKMIASLTDARGRIAIPGIYKDVRALSAVERKSYRSLNYSEKKFRKETGMLPGVDIVGGSANPLVKLWREPAISINAMQASSREALSNVVNESAWCHVGIRTAPDMNPKKTLRQLKRHLKKNAPWGVKVEFAEEAAANWWITDPAAPAFGAAARALSRGYGRNAEYVGCGGSIPFVEPFSKALGGAPALLIGVEDPYTNPHSENESLHLGDFRKAIRSSILLYDELARLR